jgi:hypothetical protein
MPGLPRVIVPRLASDETGSQSAVGREASEATYHWHREPTHFSPVAP